MRKIYLNNTCLHDSVGFGLNVDFTLNKKSKTFPTDVGKVFKIS